MSDTVRFASDSLRPAPAPDTLGRSSNRYSSASGASSDTAAKSNAPNADTAAKVAKSNSDSLSGTIGGPPGKAAKQQADTVKAELNYDSLYNTSKSFTITPITLEPAPDTTGRARAADSVRKRTDSGSFFGSKPQGQAGAGAIGNRARASGGGRAGGGIGARKTVMGPASLSNLYRKFVPVREGAMRVDSASLIPGAFSIAGIADSLYTIDWVNASLSWKRRPNLDSVMIRYRAFPYRFNSQARRFNYDSIENYFLVQPYVFNNGARQGDENFFNFGNITYNGSFGRSISFGNSQDAVVTSNLNLQISGYLADSIQISAAITDNNIPIQPDGTTADLNEFDKIFLQFKKKTWALSLGDIDLRQNQNYFMNFYKRLQGASFETNNQLSPGISNKTLVSAAIAKGKFTRNIFEGQEGQSGAL